MGFGAVCESRECPASKIHPLVKMSRQFHRESFRTEPEEWVYHIVWKGCDRSLSMSLTSIASPGNNPPFVEDATWVITCANLPDRHLRLMKGRASVQRVLSNYGYSNGSGCISIGVEGTFDAAPLRSIPLLPCAMTACDKSICGIPQRLEHSGICWFAATCFACFYCPIIRNIFTRRFPPDIARLVDACLSDPRAAEQLRRRLYFDYAFGDDPDQDPRLDGQNGFAQLCILLSALDIPTLRRDGRGNAMTSRVQNQKGETMHLRSEVGPGDDAAILAVRCFREYHRPKRRIVVNGLKYRLAFQLNGSEHCGHQVASAARGLHSHKWVHCDADAQRYGIGPIFWDICRGADESPRNFQRRWWNTWKFVLPVTRFGSQRGDFCEFSPHNRHPSLVAKQVDATTYGRTTGVVNTDFIYVALPHKK